MCPDHPGPLDDATDHVCRLRPVIEDLDRNARAYGWEIGRGKTLGETVEMSPDNPFRDPDWRDGT